MNRIEMLKRKVKRYIEMSESEEFKRADRMTKTVENLFKDIKTICKTESITKIEVEIEGEKVALEFRISMRKKLDISEIPEEIKEQHMEDCEYWIKQISRPNDVDSETGLRKRKREIM
jgi:pantothenate kinase